MNDFFFGRGEAEKHEPAVGLMAHISVGRWALFEVGLSAHAP